MDEKPCAKCREVKPLSEFYPNSRTGRYESYCKKCQKIKNYEINRKHKLRNKERFASGELKRVTEKRCWKCGRIKSPPCFGNSRSHSDGLNPTCKECARHYSNTVSNPKMRARDPNGRNGHLWHGYRLRPEQYQAMLVHQGNRCAICEKTFIKTPFVDHCHKTGTVRGLLCGACNRSVAVLDSDGYLEKAMRYIATVSARMKGISG